MTGALVWALVVFTQVGMGSFDVKTVHPDQESCEEFRAKVVSAGASSTIRCIRGNFIRTPIDQNIVIR